MTDKQSFNLFLLLDLDPTKPWNQTEFERQLQKKKQEWSRLVTSPTKAGKAASQNLALISKLQEVARDEVLRKVHAEGAQKEQNATRAEQTEKFEERLDLLQIRGYILEGELSLLVKDFASTFSEPEIRSRLKVPIKKAQEASRSRAAALDPSQAKLIHIKLSSLGKADLYDFLEIGRADNTALLDKADKKYNQVQLKGAKTADDGTIQELAGYCLTIFKSDAERAKYEETLRLQAYEGLKEDVEMIGQIAKKIEASQIEELLRKTRKQGLDLEEALAIVQEYAGKRGFAIVLPEKMVDTVRKLRKCGYCGGLNDVDKPHCVGCGRPIQEPCPKCGKMIASENTACGACGFPVGNRLYVAMLLDDTTQARSKRDLETALNCLEQARQCWPSTGTDLLGKRIRELELLVQSENKAREDLVQELDKAIGQRRFYRARELLSSLERIAPGDSPRLSQYRGQIEPRIKQSEMELAKAKTKAPEQAIRALQDVLSICQDCQEARDLLARTPPGSPANLRGMVTGRVVHLNWQPSSSSGVRYVVIRKKQSRPMAIGDGERVAIVDGTLYDDETAEVGTPIFYAIYADREGTVSSESAALEQAMLIVQDVARLTVRVSDHQVHLRWDAPPNVRRAWVVRSETGYPTRVEEGMSVSLLDKSQAADNTVENDRRYFYTVFCEFRDGADRPQLSRGAQVDATPQMPPNPVKDISITDSGPISARQLLIRWPPVAKGQVAILKATQPTGLEFGAVLPQPDLARYGELLATGANQATDQMSRMGFYYYVPVVIFQGLAYVGQERRYVCVEDVSDLAVQNLGNALRLRWRWPAECQEVLIAYGYAGWPRPHSTDCTTASLTRAQYELRGYYDITNPVKANHHIIVFATVTQGEQKITAAGEGKSARALVYLTDRIMLSYEIKKAWMSKEICLDLVVEGDGNLPALILMAKQSVLPMNKSDGEMILRVESGAIQKRHLSIPIPVGSARRQSYVHLFLEDDSLYGAVVIRHPDREKLRLV